MKAGPRETKHPLASAKKVFEAEIPSRLEKRHAVIEGVLESLKAAGCSLDPFLDRLAIDEAITNAIVHGNRSRASKKVTVRALAGGEVFGVEVADEGEGFDWSGVLDRARRRSGPALAGPGGRGIPLILESGDDVYFLDGGKRIVISWKRGRAAAGE
jgi:serine/threonine-protein kinase RsbW